MAAPLSLGFDLGGTQVRAALVQNGQALKRAATRTDVAGSIGCFEAFAAGTAQGKRARAVALDLPGSWLGKVAACEAVTARHVVEGARAEDSGSLALLEEEARYLGFGFTSLAHLFSPERIVIGDNAMTYPAKFRHDGRRMGTLRLVGGRQTVPFSTRACPAKP